MLGSVQGTVRRRGAWDRLANRNRYSEGKWVGGQSACVVLVSRGQDLGTRPGEHYLVLINVLGRRSVTSAVTLASTDGRTLNTSIAV
jgi:hypothetical protein